MLTSFRGLVAATLTTAGLMLATPAFAQDEGEAETESTGDFTLSGNVALTTDYRFRGVSLSNGNPALQSGFDVVHKSGFYIGTWDSSLDSGDAYGDLELDFYGGWSGQVSEGLTLDAGMAWYTYPSEDVGANVDYFEPYASLAFTLGPATATVGGAYAWKQDALGDKDNIYVYTDLGSDIPNTPISVSAHLGYTDGALAPPYLAGEADESGLDWSLGASAAVGAFSLGVSYIGTEGPSIDGFTDDTVVATLSASF